MSDSKLLKIYLDLIGAKIRFCAGGLVSVEYKASNDVEVFDSYNDLIIYVRRLFK